MEILAKKLEINGEVKYQSLKEHTYWVIEEALKLIDDKSLDTVSKSSGFSVDKIVDLIFFSAYFHDIGKATKEFQDTILKNTKSFHPLYSASLLVDIEDFEFSENDIYINLLLLVSLTHHTLLPYHTRNQNFNFLDEAKEFFYDYKGAYENFLNKKCEYDFKCSEDKDIKDEIEAIEDDLKYINSKEKLRIIYSYVSGILNIADWLASARFVNTKPNITFQNTPNISIFIDILPFSKLRDFQKDLSVTKESVLVEIPTGEGKTEGSLLWAVNNLFNQNSKIIYTLPTQTTSNKLYERIQNLFDKDECGLIHSSAKIYLEKEYEKENGEVDEQFKSDFLLNKSFNKPITISTIDSLLKYFINIGRFNIVTKNFLNSVIIIDEVHSYDLKLMGFLKRFLEICKSLDIKVCLMSASIPNKIKELLNIQNYRLITEKKLFLKKANEIIKKEEFLDDDLERIIENFKSGKNILVIKNTISSAVNTYKALKEFGLSNDDILLYHSTFKKKDRVKKEKLIFEKLNSNKPFILVATQVVEISLDIDFDVMFSDNAPIDALIQRFGRVNRKKVQNKKGEIFIYKTKNPLPYRESVLDLTFETLKDGYYEIGEYVKWLNIVYDKLFEDDIVIKNELTRLFEEAYEKYDKTIEKLDGIKQSDDNYDLRDINQIKGDYLLYDDYMQGNMGYEYTISLPIYFEKEYRYLSSKEIENTLSYKILKLDYSFEEGILLNKEREFDIW
jgi:CRISPR-associated endonuclease/helicase Cas3